MALTRDQISFMNQYSQFITEEQLRDHIQAHLKRISTRLSPNTMKVLDILRSHSLNAIGVSWMRIETITDLSGCSRSTVERSLRLLAKEQIIQKVTLYRPKKGGYGANLYAFLPCDGSQLTDRKETEIPTDTRDEDAFFETDSSIIQNIHKDINNKYVKDFQFEKAHWDFVPKNVPLAFVDHCRKYLAIRNGKTIFQFWGKVLLFARHSQFFNMETFLSIALEAIFSTRQAYKRDQKDWTEDRFSMYFYGAMKKIEEKRIEELCRPWKTA